MKDQNWNQTEKVLPKEGKVVLAMSPSGTVEEMKRHGKLWFFSDDSMYVYYTPVYWKEK